MSFTRWILACLRTFFFLFFVQLFEYSKTASLCNFVWKKSSFRFIIGVSRVGWTSTKLDVLGVVCVMNIYITSTSTHHQTMKLLSIMVICFRLNRHIVTHVLWCGSVLREIFQSYGEFNFEQNVLKYFSLSHINVYLMSQHFCTRECHCSLLCSRG